MHPSLFRHLRTLLPLAALLAGAGGGCHKGTQLEPGAVMLDLSVSVGVTTPDELRVFVYDDTGALWMDRRVPGTGALMPQSPTHLGTVLIQPGATHGALRVHVRGLAAGARVADGTLTVPPPAGRAVLADARRRHARRRRRRRRAGRRRRLPGVRRFRPARLLGR